MPPPRPSTAIDDEEAVVPAPAPVEEEGVDSSAAPGSSPVPNLALRKQQLRQMIAQRQATAPPAPPQPTLSTLATPQGDAAAFRAETQGREDAISEQAMAEHQAVLNQRATEIERRRKEVTDRNQFNSTELARMEGSGQQHYIDPVSKRVVPKIEPDTGKALFNESPWTRGGEPTRPAMTRRNRYGEVETKRPTLTRAADPLDDHLYADLGDGQSAPYMPIAEALKSGDVGLVKLARTADRAKRAEEWKQAIAPMGAVVDATETDVKVAQAKQAELQQQIDQLSAQLGGISPDVLGATEGGFLGIGGKPTAQAQGAQKVQAQLTERLTGLLTEHQQLTDALKPQGSLMAAAKAARSEKNLFETKAKVIAYSDMAATIEERLADGSSTNPEQDRKTLASITAAKAAWEKGLEQATREVQPPAVQAAPQPFETPLQPSEEQQFQQWKAQFAPQDSGADYDLRGAFKAGLKPDANSHWPDTFKKPNHPTFSDQSVYAKDAPDKAGHWEGDKFVPPPTDPKARWADLERRAHERKIGPLDAIKEGYDILRGKHGFGPNEVQGATPMIGSEAAGTKGGLFTVPKAEGTGTGAGIINAANKFTAGLTTPENAAIMATTGGAGALAEVAAGTRVALAARAAETAAMGGFTGAMAKDTVAAAKEARTILADPKATDAEKADAVTSVGLAALMTGASAAGTKSLAGKTKAEVRANRGGAGPPAGGTPPPTPEPTAPAGAAEAITPERAAQLDRLAKIAEMPPDQAEAEFAKVEAGMRSAPQEEAPTQGVLQSAAQALVDKAKPAPMEVDFGEAAPGEPPAAAGTPVEPSAGPAEVATPAAAPEAERNMPQWTREEMLRRGLDPARPLNDVDTAQPSVREAIQSDPTLTAEQKARTLETGSPEAPTEAMSRKSNVLERTARKTDKPETLRAALEQATGLPFEGRIAIEVASNPHTDATTFEAAISNPKARETAPDSYFDNLRKRRNEIRQQRGLDEASTAPVPIGPRDETVSTGTGVPTAKETAMLAEQRRLVDEYLAGQKSQPTKSDATAIQSANALPVRQAPENREGVRGENPVDQGAAGKGEGAAVVREAVTPKRTLESIKAQRAKMKAEPLRKALAKLDDGEEIFTERDLRDEVAALIEDGSAPKSLRREIDKFDRALEENRALGERGGLEEDAADALVAAVRKAAGPEGESAAAPVAPEIAEPALDTSPITNAPTKAAALAIGGRMIRESKSNANMRAAQKALQEYKEPLRQPVLPARTEGGKAIPGPSADLTPPAQMKPAARIAELEANGVKTVNGKPLAEANAAELINALGKLRRGVLEEPTSQPKLSDRAIAALQKAKINKPGSGKVLSADPFTLAYDGAIDLAILGVRAGRAVADVVKLAIQRFKAMHPKHTPEELAKVETAVRSAIDNRPPEPEPGKNKSKVPPSLREVGTPAADIEYDVRAQNERMAEARALIDKDGSAAAERSISDRALPADTRVALGGVLLEQKMEALKNATPEQAPELVRDIQRITAATRSGVSTESGQGVAMHNKIYENLAVGSAMEYARHADRQRLEKMGGEDTGKAMDEAAKALNKATTQAERDAAIDKLKEKYTTGPTRKALDQLKRIEVAKELNNLGVLTRDDLVNVAGNALGIPGIEQAKLKHIAELADRITNAKNHAERSRAELELADTLSIYKGVSPLDLEASILTLNILSGPTTQGANIEGNALQMLSNLGTTALVNPTKIAPLAKGFMDGIGLGATQAKSILATGRSTRDFQDKTGGGMSHLANINYARDFPATGKVGGAVLTTRARLVDKIGRFMKAADAVFYYPAREAYARLVATKLLEGEYSGAELAKRVTESLHTTPEAFEVARKQAVAEGYEGIDLGRRVSDIIEEKRAENPSGKEVVKQSERFAAETTFTNEPVGLAGVIYRNLATTVRDADVGGVPVLKPWAMFLRTPANVFNATTNFTPLGASRAKFGMKGEKYRKGGSGEGQWRNFSRDERNRLYVQSIIGTTLMGGLVAQALRGKDVGVTASGPNNPSDRRQLQQGGWTPYSIKVGDKYVSYKDSPLLVPLAIVGHVADAVKYQKSKSDLLLESKIADAVGQAPQIIFQTSMLSGMADLMSSMSNQGGGAQAVGRTLASIPANLVIPYNRLLQQVDQSFDEKTYQNNPVVGAVPFLRRTGTPNSDVQGRPQTYTPSRRFGSTESKDPVDSLLRAKNVFIPEVGKDTKVGNRVMTDAERDRFRQMSGQRIRIRLQALAPMLHVMSQEEVQKRIDSVAREERERMRPYAMLAPAK